MIKNLNVFNDDAERISYLSNGYSAKIMFSRTIEIYNRYKLGLIDDISEADLQDMKILEVLEKLGFSLNEVGTYFYKNMVRKAIHYMNGKNNNGKSISKQELLEQMKCPFSQFYTDVARNDLDIGIKTFHSHVEQAFGKISYTKADAALLYDLHSNFSRNTDYGEYAFIIGQYVTTKEKEGNKGAVKQITMVPVNKIQIGN